MDAVKAWYHSRTIWASIVTVAAAAGAAFGLPVSEADQIAATDTILQLVAAVAGLVAIFGRIAAKSRIG